MSTNEQNNTRELNQNGNKKFETNNFLENQSSNSAVEGQSDSGKKCAEIELICGHVGLDENDGTSEKSENPIVNSCTAIDIEEIINRKSEESENLTLTEDSNFLKNEEVAGSLEEPSDSQEIEMSRSNIKSRLPNKTTSRSALSNSNSKVPGELSGQPSVRSTKEDIKYWKNREQELLSKIAELESKVTNKESTQLQEKSECDAVKMAATPREKENYKNRIQTNEKESFNKQKEIPAETNLKNAKCSDEVINHLKLQNEDLRNALAKMTAILRDKTTMCISQEKKNAALVNQVESLKEVVAITKDLLNIRNMEVQHLSNDISAMETKIDCERQRHNQMLIKMDEAVKLNSELKKEYENQLRLFQHLRDSYEEKILLLSRDRKNEKKENLPIDKDSINSNNCSSDSQTQNLAL